MASKVMDVEKGFAEGIGRIGVAERGLIGPFNGNVVVTEIGFDF